jgi:hypothetical protein
MIVSVFAPNLRKLLPKHVEKSCNRRRRFTGRAGGDKVKWRRLWLDWDKRHAGLVKAANGTRRRGNTNSGGHRHQHGLDPCGLIDNSWRKAGICAEHVVGLAKESLSCSGELNRAFGADEQLYFQFFLERSDLLADSGLSNTNAFSVERSPANPSAFALGTCWRICWRGPGSSILT